MIKVRYWPQELRLTVEGHALESDMQENPLICSAASMLVFSLMNTMDGINSRRWAKCAYMDNGNGFAYMRAFKPKWHKFKAVRVAVGMTFGGLAMLAHQHPEAVQVEVCTGQPFDDEEVIKNASLIAKK